VAAWAACPPRPRPAPGPPAAPPAAHAREPRSERGHREGAPHVLLLGSRSSNLPAASPHQPPRAARAPAPPGASPEEPSSRQAWRTRRPLRWGRQAQQGGRRGAQNGKKRWTMLPCGEAPLNALFELTRVDIVNKLERGTACRGVTSWTSCSRPRGACGPWKARAQFPRSRTNLELANPPLRIPKPYKHETHLSHLLAFERSPIPSLSGPGESGVAQGERSLARLVTHPSQGPVPDRGLALH
jgi:hypothetical protein